MPSATAQQSAPPVSMQGVLVPQAAINPKAFFERTQRMNIRQAIAAFPGFGATVGNGGISMQQVGIIAKVVVRFTGVLTVTLGGGTCASTAQWPYNLLKRVRLSANGQSNLFNLSGWQLKARQFTERSDCNDRGVARGIGGASPGTARTQGTLSLNNENWGIGQNVTAIPGAPTNYTVDLEWELPVAFDQVFLQGAIFAQTSSTDLRLDLDTAAVNDLFALTGAAAVAMAGSFQIDAVVYTIPQGGDGQIVVPDLSLFHSVIASRMPGPVLGTNEVKLAGQGVGRQLMRTWWQVINGATPAPLPVNSVNFGQVGWRFGGNDTPEVWEDGTRLAQLNENLFGSDFASMQGFGFFDWASEHAFRDTIDEGMATELRLLITLQNGVALVAPAVEYVQETLFTGAVGA